MLSSLASRALRTTFTTQNVLKRGFHSSIRRNEQFLNANAETFSKAISNEDNVVLVDFYADWCGPCKVISPIFQKLFEQFSHADFYKVDVDDQQDISQEVGIRAMPTFVAFKNGSKLKEIVGANPSGLQELIQGLA
uniref:Thioredoxin n=1 Tax=Taiwanofungus camphoratus TaxID=2696576 RepID=A9UKK4_TAICA|nr:thioredoxin [Taiwanofungus camphoratus]